MNNLRTTIFNLNQHAQLSTEDSAQLWTASGLDGEPPNVQRYFWLIGGAIAALLLGCGLMFWIAANWDDMTRVHKFLLLQAVVAITALGAACIKSARLAFLLVLILSIGGLFAYFGQTYQTGADPWQLFAAWAALTLPLCFVLPRQHNPGSDVIWSAWCIVTGVAISLWLIAHHDWMARFSNDDQHLNLSDLLPLFKAITVSFLIWLWLSPISPFKRWIGRSTWAARLMFWLSLSLIAQRAILALFSSQIEIEYYLGFALSAALLAWLVFNVKLYDIFLVSLCALLFDTLLIGGLIHFLFSSMHSESSGLLLLIGCAIAGLLALTVTQLMKLHSARTHERHSESESESEGEAK